MNPGVDYSSQWNPPEFLVGQVTARAVDVGSWDERMLESQVSVWVRVSVQRLRRCDSRLDGNQSAHQIAVYTLRVNQTTHHLAMMSLMLDFPAQEYKALQVSPPTPQLPPFYPLQKCVH
jgi:hypothetical protein